MDGNVLSDGPDGLGIGDIFGVGAPTEVAENESYTVNVTIPRGYKAVVDIYNDSDNDGIYDTAPIGGKSHISLGDMVSYVRIGNNINLASGSAAATEYSGKVISNNVQCKQKVVLSYEKIEEFKFNGDLWLNTVYAKGRVTFDASTPSVGRFTYDDAGYTWKFSTTSRGWELDSLIINGTQLDVPMVKLSSTKTESRDTVLPTGTKVNLSVSADSSTGKRNYTLTLTDCYEDITISSGNTVGNSHKEFVVYELRGTDDGQFWNDSVYKDFVKGTLIGRRGNNSNYSDPIRFKRAIGYNIASVYVSSKEGSLLQYNDTNKDGTGNEYIQFLVLKDSVAGTDGDISGHIINGTLYSDDNFDIVSHDDWRESADGYYYFRLTKAMDDYMNVSEQGVVLLNINAEPISVAIDYITGENRTGAPDKANIVNMPELDADGGKGYNCEGNSRIIFSAKIPRDKTANYVFDHWEVLTVNKNYDGSLIDINNTAKELNGTKVKYGAGEDIHIQEKLVADFEDCYYYDYEEGRAVFTIRPSWRSAVLNEPISYNVHYFVNGTEIFERNHPVNKGAVVVTDLYKGNGTELSESIQNVLKYNNKLGKDYTEGGKARYTVDKRYTTMRIDGVTADNNKAEIHLVSANTDIHAEKHWSGEKSEASVTIMLQRKTDPDVDYENVGNEVSISSADGWKHIFTDVPVYKDENDLRSKYIYRVVELDESGSPIENGEKAVFNTHAYWVTYLNTDKDSIITNTYEGPTVGALIVKKTVSGASGETDKNWSFTVTLNDTSVNGTYGSIDFKAGVAKFTLKDGESRTATGLPKDTAYTVTEDEADKKGYTTTKTGDTGTIPGGKMAEAVFNNHRDKKPSHTSSDKIRIYYYGNGNTDGTAPNDINTYGYGERAYIMGAGSLEKEGYVFRGWNTKADGTGTTYKYDDRIDMYENVYLYAMWERKDSNGANEDENVIKTDTDKENAADNIPELNTEKHYAYMLGYPDETFRPDSNMTRAEVTVIFSRLIKAAEANGTGSGFSDVAADKWYYDGICLMEQYGIVTGYPDGSFKPDNPITRAEFAAIAAKFDNLKETEKTNFSDLSDNHWAVKFIEMAHRRGWISGYPDETVRPENYITRAEVVSIINRMLERSGDAGYIDEHMDEIRKYTDINKNHWAYLDIAEASNEHLYTKDEKEVWTEIKK